MLTITTEKHTLYINIALFKKRLKNAIITLLKVSTFILAFSGVMWIIGTAVESDLNNITIAETFYRVLQGVICCGVAWFLNFVKKVIK